MYLPIQFYSKDITATEKKRYFYGVYIEDECAIIAYPSIKINTERKKSESPLLNEVKT